MRVDRPMAAEAVSRGRRIAVVAAIESTVEPTCALLREEAARAGRDIELIVSVCGRGVGPVRGGRSSGIREGDRRPRPHDRAGRRCHRPRPRFDVGGGRAAERPRHPRAQQSSPRSRRRARAVQPESAWQRAAQNRSASSGASSLGPTWRSSHAFMSPAATHVARTRSAAFFVCSQPATGHVRVATKSLPAQQLDSGMILRIPARRRLQGARSRPS